MPHGSEVIIVLFIVQVPCVMWFRSDNYCSVYCAGAVCSEAIIVLFIVLDVSAVLFIVLDMSAVLFIAQGLNGSELTTVLCIAQELHALQMAIILFIALGLCSSELTIVLCIALDFMDQK